MTTRLLVPALLTACLGAQTLVYDNGPLQTAAGVSLLQDDAPTDLTVFGYGIQRDAATDNGAIDDFAVGTAMTIGQVEIFAYQTGSTQASPITGVYLAFYDADPRTGALPMTGSPTLAQNLLQPSSINQWSGLYRDLESAPGSTDRPIMRVRVALPAPLMLTTGVYWLQIQASGDPRLAGPWMPPITTIGEPETGSGAIQRIGATGQFIAPIASGAGNRQGLPFRFYGSGPVVGSLVPISPGCGQVSLSVVGSPTLGGYVHSRLRNVTSIPLLSYGLGNVSAPFCGCTIGHNWLQVLITPVGTLRIPLIPVFAGAQFAIQGADLGAVTGCPNPQVSFSTTYRVTLNQ